MLRINRPVQWMSDIAMTECDITVKDGNSQDWHVRSRIPVPSGWAMDPPYSTLYGMSTLADRILNSFRRGSQIWCLVQANQGEDVRFAMVPREAIEYISTNG